MLLILVLLVNKYSKRACAHIIKALSLGYDDSSDRLRVLTPNCH